MRDGYESSPLRGAGAVRNNLARKQIMHSMIDRLRGKTYERVDDFARTHNPGERARGFVKVNDNRPEWLERLADDVQTSYSKWPPVMKALIDEGSVPSNDAARSALVCECMRFGETAVLSVILTSLPISRLTITGDMKLKEWKVLRDAMPSGFAADTLELSQMAMNKEESECALSIIGKMTNLRALELINVAVAKCGSCPALHHLRSVRLSSTKERDAYPLLHQVLTRSQLSEFQIKGESLSKDNASWLSLYIQGQGGLTSLHLGDPGFSDDRLATILWKLGSDTSLKHLNLQGAKLGEKSIGELIKALNQNRTLTHLYLPSLKKVELKQLRAAMEGNFTLRKLKIEGLRRRSPNFAALGKYVTRNREDYRRFKSGIHPLPNRSAHVEETHASPVEDFSIAVAWDSSGLLESLRKHLDSLSPTTKKWVSQEGPDAAPATDEGWSEVVCDLMRCDLYLGVHSILRYKRVATLTITGDMKPRNWHALSAFLEDSVIHTLKLRNIRVRDDEVQPILDCIDRMPRLRTLVLDRVAAKGSVKGELRRPLRLNSLVLNHSKYPGNRVHMYPLVHEVLANAQLREMTIEAHFSDEEHEGLATVLQAQRGLTTLTLKQFGLHHSYFGLLQNNTSITVLNLRSTITQAELDELAKMLEGNAPVTRLVMRGCDLDRLSTLERLAGASGICELDLGGAIGLPAEVLPPTLESLATNTSLRRLNLEVRHAMIGEECAIALGNMLKGNRTLTHLWLPELAPFFAKVLVDAMQNNTTVRTLRIDNPRLGQTHTKQLNELIRRNRRAAVEGGVQVLLQSAAHIPLKNLDEALVRSLAEEIEDTDPVAATHLTMINRRAQQLAQEAQSKWQEMQELKLDK